jgi:DNA-binding winged helix-turn-helix (wHTH) protein/Tfp pilus assembly protein PilF
MRLHFGSFILDSLCRHISHLDRSIHLNPKAFDVLFYLAENPGRVVTKTELLDAIWQGMTVSEPNLTQTIFLLRKALKSFDPHSYIVTIPGQGYQFAAEVTAQEARQSLLLNGGGPTNGRKLETHASPVYDWLSNRTTQSLQKAIQWCERRTQDNPNAAPAFVDLANTYCLLMSIGDIPPKQALPLIENAVIRALESDPPAYCAFAPLGFLRCHFDRDWSRAERDFQRALDECPNDLMAHHWYSEFLAAWGRFDESLNLLRRAQKRDPRSLLIQTDIGMTLFWAKQYKDSETALLYARDMEANFPRTNTVLGSTYLQQGRYEESLQTLQQAATEGSKIIRLTLLAESCAASEKKQAVNKVWQCLQSLSGSRYVSSYAQAFTCKNIGKTGRFFELLEQAEQEHDYWLIWQRVNPYFDPFRNDPRFQRLLHTTKLA